MVDVTVEPRAVTRKSPPRRWRNVYWLAKRIHLRECEAHTGGMYGPGRFVPRRIWPSREIAETKALNCIARAADGQHIVYVGPEEA